MSLGTINIILNLIAILFTGGMLGVVLRHRQGMRGLAVKDGIDVRDHYAEELQRVIDRQHACEDREVILRQRVTELEDKLTGMARQFVAFQLEVAKAIPPERWTPPMQQALASLSEIAGVRFP